MNFFSHAIVATRRSEDPRWILGSMLPDFVSMAGLRLASVTGDTPLERGVAFHHTCDDAFHSAPIFVDLMEQAREELELEGLDSGPAMAIGHVGVELLLDGHLVEQGGVTPGYRAAMIETPVGSMHGSYQMLADDGVQFDAEIPAFALSVPRTLH